MIATWKYPAGMNNMLYDINVCIAYSLERFFSDYFLQYNIH